VHPDLAKTVPEADQRPWHPPRTPRELRQWGRFVQATVAHFKGRVTSFEMWNEPNVDAFWRPAPSPAEYARLLVEGYRGARRAWPSARVVFAGLSHNDVGYLQRYYSEARRLVPDAASHRYFFDALSVHPYTDGRSPDDASPDTVVQGAFGLVDKSFSGLRLMKAVLDRSEGAGDGKPILVGEYGFTTTGRNGTPPVPDSRRAYFLKRAVALAEDMPFVSSLSWYGFLPDAATEPGWAIAPDERGTGWTYQALVDLATGGGPTIRLPEPSTLRPGPAAIRPVLVGLDAGEVVHTELWVEGELQAEADGPQVQWTATGKGSRAGRVQLVVYTRGQHAWASDVVTLTGDE